MINTEEKMSLKNKDGYILIIFLLSGLVIGGMLGELAAKIPSLWWLSYGQSFGLSTPLELDLSIIKRGDRIASSVKNAISPFPTLLIFQDLN